jgi:hypothetical protein
MQPNNITRRSNTFQTFAQSLQNLATTVSLRRTTAFSRRIDQHRQSRASNHRPSSFLVARATQESAPRKPRALHVPL